MFFVIFDNFEGPYLTHYLNKRNQTLESCLFCGGLSNDMIFLIRLI